jgi:hypothetical protein
MLPWPLQMAGEQRAGSTAAGPMLQSYRQYRQQSCCTVVAPPHPVSRFGQPPAVVVLLRAHNVVSDWRAATITRCLPHRRLETMRRHGAVWLQVDPDGPADPQRHVAREEDIGRVGQPSAGENELSANTVAVGMQKQVAFNWGAMW